MGKLTKCCLVLRKKIAGSESNGGKFCRFWNFDNSAKVSLQKSGLAGQLLKIKNQYECLLELIEKMENAKYTIKEAVQAIPELDFGEDTCIINQYIKKRMQNNDISEIINMERQDISPVVYHMFQNSQPISASVKRSFSMLKKLLAKDRNFKVKNVRHHLNLLFNASIW